MNIKQTERENLYKALGLFLEAFRPYLVSAIINEYGSEWEPHFAETLSPQQLDNWNEGLRNGTPPEALIDYHHLKYFAVKQKTLLRKDFGKKTNDLPNWLGEIADVRHKIAHYSDVDQDEATKAWIHMKTIAAILEMSDLEEEVLRLRENRPAMTSVQSPSAGLRPWFQIVTPHIDIRQGHLDESVFAANLSEVALGSGREIYTNPVLFFEKTYFTNGLKSIAKTVVKGLNGEEDAENRVISLQTGFGGGKTHTLISLFHLCRWGKNAKTSDAVAPLIEYTGVPEFDSANIAVFTNTTNDPANGRTTPEGLVIRTIWGELAYQLGGLDAYEIVRKNDEGLIAPAGLFKAVLAKCRPALILIDELADYCIKASARQTGASTLSDQTISFMQELTEAIAGSENCVAIVTLPASPQEVGNTAQAHQVLASLEQRVRRVGADNKPVSDEEIYEVIRRRLFEDIGSEEEISAVVSEYMQMFQANWMELPSQARLGEYRTKLIKSYPFHPELIDVFRIRWASNHDFQRTRGVLRLLAAIVGDLWKRRNSLSGRNLLIGAGAVDFTNLDALSGQLKRLYGSGFDAVISADVSGSASNAHKIDENKPQFGQNRLVQSIAAVILLNSFGGEGVNKGLSILDIKLNLIEPGSFNHNDINGGLDELEQNAYYLYFAQGAGGKRYWFHTKPNIKILINTAGGEVRPEDINAEILRRVTARSQFITSFNVLVNPKEGMPEQTKLTMVFLGPEEVVSSANIGKAVAQRIEELATKRGNSERIYRNTMLFAAPSELAVGKLRSDSIAYLAARKISDDYSSQLETEERDQLRRLLDESSRALDASISVAYSMILKHSAKAGISAVQVQQFRDNLDGQFNENVYSRLRDEEWVLEGVGLGKLGEFNLLPSDNAPVKLKELYEAFLRFDDKPMIKNSGAITNSINKYCQQGAFCVAAGDGKEFTKYYLGEPVPFLDVTDSSFWLLTKESFPKPEPLVPGATVESTPTSGAGSASPIGVPSSEPEPEPKKIDSITVSGRVPLEQFSSLFNYFVSPFAMTGHKVEVEVSFRIRSNDADPLTRSKQQYKNAKEAAKQLGLKFGEE